ncbi:MAG: hypothetical protein QOK16_2096 [Solirubrobacteraceae bacterium]|nr:hypothetical protein [Solirubrobacteraceae bacterium]
MPAAHRRRGGRARSASVSGSQQGSGWCVARSRVTKSWWRLAARHSAVAAGVERAYRATRLVGAQASGRAQGPVAVPQRRLAVSRLPSACWLGRGWLVAPGVADDDVVGADRVARSISTPAARSRSAGFSPEVSPRSRDCTRTSRPYSRSRSPQPSVEAWPVVPRLREPCPPRARDRRPGERDRCPRATRHGGSPSGTVAFRTRAVGAPHACDESSLIAACRSSLNGGSLGAPNAPRGW